MTEGKIRVKDLITELDVPAKDMLRALRDLGLPSRSTAGSVDGADALRLREYFVSRKTESVETTEVQPNVIVRRRRKDQQEKTALDNARQEKPLRDKPEPQVAGQAAEPVQAVAEPEPVVTENRPQVEEPAPAAAEATETRAEAPSARGEKEEQRPKRERISRKSLRNVGARIISKPGDQPATPPPPPPVVEEAPKPVPKKPVRQGKTLAQEIREREAAQKALAQKAAEQFKASLTRGARVIKPPKLEEVEPEAEKQPEEEHISLKEQTVAAHAKAAEPAEPVDEGPSVAEQLKEKAQKRAATPDASAAPSGSSMPSLGKKVEPAETKTPQPPQVRVISRPVQAAPAPRRAAGKGAERPDRQERGARPAEGRQPGASRSGASRGSMPVSSQPPRQSQPMPPQALDGRDGQSKKKRLKGRRTVDFQQGDFGRHGEEDETVRFNRGRSRRKSAKVQAQQPVTQPIKAAKRKIRVDEAIRVADMAHQLGVKVNEIIKVLFDLGIMATINQSLDIDTATLVAAEFGYEVEKAGFSEDDYLAPKETDAPESLKPRPPVVTIMGHVDHGKTSLLDAVRKSNVTSGEAGGITQHIGAYHVKTRRGEIVFLDTPGHEAFTAMRARGAQITDLVILVVAADDGVMEQTREAISHSKAANVPIVVAVNKMDKQGADPDRVLRELSELGLQPEDWGGDTIVAKVSAKTRQGLDDLLELVALQSEIMDLKANPDKPARGHIVEAKLDKGRGPVATVLIQEGTLKPGDNFVCGTFSGRVRALTNDQGKKVKEAGPSIPVEVQGFDGVPDAGEQFLVVADDKVARRIADSRAIKRRERDLASESRVTLETFLAHANEKEAQTLNLVLKADVQGSLEAISEALHKLSTDKVKINIVHGGTGAISESDILLASASQAIVIGFNVRPTAKIKDIAEHENVDIRFYDIIYKLADDVKSAMAGMLAPVQKEVYLGQAEVRQTFSLPKVGTIAGTYVADGKISRNAGVRLLRDGVVVYTGRISSLKRFKDDAKEVVKGNECGVGLENYNDIKVGDIIEAFETVQEAATL